MRLHLLSIKKYYFIAVVLFIGFTAPIMFSSPASAEADIVGWLCAGVNLDPSEGPCEATGDLETEGLSLMLNKLIGIASLIIGVISVIMIMIGGVKYITSGGDSGNVSGAKNTILYAVIGLIIVALAQVIVRFVLGSISEVTTNT